MKKTLDDVKGGYEEVSGGVRKGMRVRKTLNDVRGGCEKGYGGVREGVWV